MNFWACVASKKSVGYFCVNGLNRGIRDDDEVYVHVVLRKIVSV